MPTKHKRLLAWIKENKELVVCFLLYLVITFLFALIFHENWEDEAQAWLIARDASLPELISQMKIEGHLLPWYLLIRPVAKLGLPFKAINIVSWAIGGVTAWLYLRYLPCKKWKRVALIFSLPMIYFYPVVARSYCLLPLAIILLIMSYPKRFTHPWPYLLAAVLAANVHIHCFVFALTLGVEFLIEWRRKRKHFLEAANRRIIVAMAGSILIATLSYLPILGSMGESAESGIKLKPFEFVQFFAGNVQAYAAPLAATFSGLFIMALIAVLVCYLILYRRDVFYKMTPTVLWDFAISSLVWAIVLPQRAFIPIFCLIFFLLRTPKPVTSPELKPLIKLGIFLAMLTMIVFCSNIFFSLLAFCFAAMAFLPRPLKARYDNLPNIRALVSGFYGLLLAVAVISGINYLYKEFKYTYSDALATSQYIREHLSTEPGIFLTNVGSEIIYTPVIAYLDNDFRLFNVNAEEFYSYVSWPQPDLTKQIEVKDLRQFCLDGQKCYYVLYYSPSTEAILSAVVEKTMIDQWEQDNILVKLYDSGAEDDDWNQADTEHYRIYEVIK